jgi:ferredoxin-nitrate reductase
MLTKDSGNSFTSTCSYCGVGCGVVVKKDQSGMVSVEGDESHPANKGMLCSKGRNLHYVVNDKTDRLLYPEMRWSKNHPRVRVSWEQALDRATAVFKTIVQKYGPDSVGFYVSGQCLTEEYYVVNKLAKGFIGTNNIDTNSRLCMSTAVVGYKMSLGEDAVPVSYEDIELADCFYITGANPAWCHPIIFRRLEKHKAENPHVKIIVADPRVTETCSIADIHLQLKPGTDIYLNHAIAKCLVDENYIDPDFIGKHTNGFDVLKDTLSKFSLEELAKECDVPMEKIKLAAKYIGTSKGFISMWAMGLNQSVIGVNKNLSLINLSLITGKIGKPGSGPFSLTGQPNAMGGREVGGLCNLLPAHRNLDNPEHRKEVANFWQVASVPEKPGYSATEMFAALNDGKLKAIWIICTNPLVSLPNARIAEAALKKAQFVIVQDISGSSITSEFADIVLPAAGWLEKDGTMTNSDRRISYLNKVIDPPGEALADAEIICRFARKMGFKGFQFKNAEEIYDEHKMLTKATNMDISGLSYHYLKTKGTAQWPFKSVVEGETKRLFTDFRFYTVDQKAKIYSPDCKNESEQPNVEYPLILTTGRIRDQWHTMTKTGKVNRLNQHISDPFLEINPLDAEKRKISEGELVLVKNRNQEVRVRAQLTEQVKKGVVFLPMHWGKIAKSDMARANNLTTDRVDPKSKEPDFKFSIVQVERFVKQKQKIIIVGAGAAAYKFITTYRQLNQTDTIEVFTKEEYPFYNRVQLPDYISGTKKWEDLVKMTLGEFSELNVGLHTNNAIESIDKNKRHVVDAKGRIHNYDILLLATGSRANLPKGIITDFEGVFKIRDRDDADRLKRYLIPGHRVLIVGGGLLGLEAAASLLELNMGVTIINRVSRLMDRQLDFTSSELLSGILIEKGITIYSNDEIENFSKVGTELNVFLKSGKSIICNAIIFAIGTIPNIEIAVKAGLHTSRGVVVNSHLQSSNPDIFALGEIAEFEGKMYGITAAAEEQAEIVARYICGDQTAVYKGSTLMNILKFPGVELCSIGLPVAPKGDESYQEVIFIDKANNYYKKCIVQYDKLVGAILLGDKAEFVEFKDLINRKLELSEKRLSLLRSGAPLIPVKGKLVCSCNNVGKGNIEEAITKGITGFDEIVAETGACTGCGSCRPEVKMILQQALKLVEQ